jgi:CheY-specific phosphatase CheX
MSPVNVTQSRDIKLAGYVIKAATEVLGTMANTRVVVKEVIAQENFTPTGDISAIIGISGEEGQGVVAISFPKNLANLLIARLLGSEPEEISEPECRDGVGELVNMISGAVKATLAKEGGANASYKLSLPSVIQGPMHEVSIRVADQPYQVILFEAESHQFILQISFKKIV